MQIFMLRSLAMRILAWTTGLLGILPFVPYVWARLSGRLSSEDTWELRGGNHGPWWDCPWEGVIIVVPLLGLVLLWVLTLLTGIALAVSRKRGLYLAQGTILCLAQLAAVMLQIGILFWTID